MSRIKPLRRNINSKGAGIEIVFLFVLDATLKIYVDSMTQTKPNYFILDWFRPP